MLKVNHLNFLKTQIHKCYLWSTDNHYWLDPTKCSESCFRISELTKSYLDGKKEFIRIISNLKEDIQQWQQIQQHKNLTKVSHWLQISCVCDSRNKKGWVLRRYQSLFFSPDINNNKNLIRYQYFFFLIIISMVNFVCCFGNDFKYLNIKEN